MGKTFKKKLFFLTFRSVWIFRSLNCVASNVHHYTYTYHCTSGPNRSTDRLSFVDSRKKSKRLISETPWAVVAVNITFVNTNEKFLHNMLKKVFLRLRVPSNMSTKCVYILFSHKISIPLYGKTVFLEKV